MQVSGIAAVVTGGASGLGGATAEALAKQGAKVYALDLPNAIEKAAVVDGVTYVAADVTSPEQVQAAVGQAASGEAPLRVAVNCAGVGTAGRILSKKGVHDLDVYRKVIEVNLIGTFNVLRLSAEAIAKTAADDNGQRGVIINTASIAAFDGQIGQAAYSSSKGGVVGLTLPAARDLATSGIRVMTIAPGIIDTPMLAGVGDEFRAALAEGVPFPKRLGLPAEYAKLALSIIDHDYLNGEVIRMDGALRMAPR
ncbi:SDR family NAD(P)-dependent oxidoreductase [Kibdelosporangium phytohabitans]|uniref:3-hydroxy-2-methylbutyryl-CoA dehydrogenase n=1 Tax=Kibdelosporangium phytohabitans TaxID=860235 RepID=A0A0N9HU36_9PSEU|nr:SDR family NAD(P)-dependent oxidoreductase [Kibdelosporangium phytohabitans]ALG05586.1 3-hydroxy-2-methylbutyryl-CoA dehydrogenase [Kibdelosporangium phytohabitans]MBE1466451.1 NAD(P)-dependent dehydrogenase (short-subunit alcohol dehydrogenase family) [Kibdelosporangium phytohabitans]